MSTDQAVFDPNRDRVLNQTDIEYLDEELKKTCQKIYILGNLSICVQTMKV
jgi:hypothetical protein